MVSSDTVVGIVGAVILTGAMIAVFYIEADREDPGPGVDLGQGAQTFSFRYTENTMTDYDDVSGGPLPQGQSDNLPLEGLPFTFSVHAQIEWAGHELADTPLMDTPEFRIELIDRDADDAVLQSATGSGPELMFEPNDNQSAPERMNLTVAADNLAEAQDFVAQFMQEDADVQQSVRNWAIRVTLVDDGVVAEDPLGTGQTNQGYSITVHIDHWYPEPRET